MPRSCNDVKEVRARVGSRVTRLEAILDRLIPPHDDAPGARELGVAPRIAAAVLDLDALLASLAAFERRSPAEQDAILDGLDRAGDPVFVRLVAVAHEMFYADPRSWPAIGYTTNIPGRP